MPDDAQLCGIWTGTSTATFLGPVAALAAFLPLAGLTWVLAWSHASASRALLGLTATRASRS